MTFIWYLEKANVPGIGKFYITCNYQQICIDRIMEGVKETVIIDAGQGMWARWVNAADVFDTYEEAFAEAERRNIVIQDATL